MIPREGAKTIMRTWIAIRLVLLLSLGVIFQTGCDKSQQSKTGSLIVQIAWSEGAVPSGISYIVLTLSGEGITTITQTFPPTKPNLNITNLAIGSKNVVLEGKSTAGTVLYKGQSDIIIKKDENALIVITLTSVALPISSTLTVTRSGSGSGTVTSTPTGIDCGATSTTGLACSASYASSASVTLTATPDTGSVFDGWSGDCTGTSTSCTVTMTAPKSVSATFTLSSSPSSAVSQKVVPIATGRLHTCALTGMVGVKCWGNNFNGQLGDGTTMERHSPVDVIGLTSGVSAISAGLDHTCALTHSGGVKCWGINGDEQLGDGTFTDRHSPVDVSGLTSGVIAITAGGFHSCAVISSGGVKCWGENVKGQLGDGTTTDQPAPVNVVGLTSGVSAVAAGKFHTCALTATGAVKCWGFNGNGQLGDGTFTERYSPVDVSGLTSGVIAIDAALFHTCALTTTGAVKCWGFNGNGQLGDGTTTDQSTPVTVNGLTSGIVGITAGGNHTCAITTSGGAKCLGINLDGQLGDGTLTERHSPVSAVGLTSGVFAISAGQFHTCALATISNVSTLKCWGYNGNGQLGDGTTTDRLTPTDVSILASEVTPTPSSALKDSWSVITTTNAPSARSARTAVWTGTKMLVWGNDSDLTGGTYDPAINSWDTITSTNAPTARWGHTAVWTGSKMLVWGGVAGEISNVRHNTGGVYDPSTNSWTAITTTNAPTARSGHTAVWTGSKMLVWGGSGSSGFLNTGGIYDPSTNTWTAITTTNAPTIRDDHTAVWTGSKMLVWGGRSYANLTALYLNTGGIYDPSTNSWTAITTTNAPTGRENPSAIWTGSKMLIWGGYANGPIYFNTGGIYDPSANSWSAMTTTNAPTGRYGNSAVWTGSKMLVWGGFGNSDYLNTGGIYDPSANSWSAMTTTNAPTERSGHGAVWTGSKMLIWGGYGATANYFNNGGAYE